MKHPEFVACHFHFAPVSWTIVCQSHSRSRQVKSTSHKSGEIKQKCAEREALIYKSRSVGCVTLLILCQIKHAFYENPSSLSAPQADHSLHGKHKLGQNSGSDLVIQFQTIRQTQTTARCVTWSWPGGTDSSALTLKTCRCSEAQSCKTGLEGGKPYVCEQVLLSLIQSPWVEI